MLSSCGSLGAGTQPGLRQEAGRHFKSEEIGHICCLGRCHEGGAFQFADQNYSGQSVQQLETLFQGGAGDSVDRYAVVSDLAPPILTAPFPGLAEYFAPLQSWLKRGPDELLVELRDSKLRGRGGAGFPLHLKWQSCRETKGSVKYIVCNADEGDPVLTIRPAAFAANPLTAASNSFQSAEPGAARQLVSRAAFEEFQALTERLTAADVDVIVVGDTPQPEKPDAVFPNNWFSTHADGTVVLYPLMAPNRRLERRLDVLSTLAAERGLAISRVIDLSAGEAQGRYLEGTGSLVLDRVNHIAYVCTSPRTDRDAVSEFSARLDYDIVAFRALDHQGTAIYHTNVMLSIGSEFAVVAADCIVDADRERVLASLQATRTSLIEVSRAQMERFACNILEVRTRSGASVVLMSDTAEGALGFRLSPPPGVDAIVSVAIPTIERFGGGSLRCMLAEIFLPPAGAVS